MKDIKDLMASGVMLGVGSDVIGKVGGSTASDSQKALGNVAGYMPLMGTATGAGWALDELGNLVKKKR